MMENGKIKIPVWFWVLSVFFLLWNIMGVFSFLMHVFISEADLAAMPNQERALYGEFPIWTYLIFAIAVLTGILGSTGLLLKKKWAKSLFVISLGAIILQMVHNVFFTSAMEVYGVAQAVTMPILVAVFAIILVWFSDFAIKKKWLK